MFIGKFLSPRNDFAFKHIFGSEKHQDILIHFLNDMLEFKGDKVIQKVKYLPTNQDQRGWKNRKDPAIQIRRAISRSVIHLIAPHFPWPPLSKYICQYG